MEMQERLRRMRVNITHAERSCAKVVGDVGQVPRVLRVLGKDVGGGFEDFVCSPLTFLGEDELILKRAYFFRWVGSTTNQNPELHLLVKNKSDCKKRCDMVTA